MNLLIITEASKTIGMGHIIREITLAEKLKENGYNIIFLVKNRFSEKIIESNGYQYLRFNSNRDIFLTIERVLPKIVIIDRKKNPSIPFIKKLRNKFPQIKIVNIDDNGPARVLPDIVVDPTINEEINKKMKTSVKTKYLLGTKFTMLREKFSKFHDKKKRIGQLENIFICFGGTDSQGITLKIIKLLKSIRNKKYNLQIVVGKNFSYKSELEKLKNNSFHHLNIYENPDNIMEIIFNSDIGLISFGTLFYESATIGTPPILINPTSYHTETTDMMLKNFSKTLAINLGDFNKIGVDNLREAINKLTPIEIRKKMSDENRRYFDGRGIRRIVEEIKKL